MKIDRDAIIYRLLKQGTGIREISKETGISRPTVRKIARESFPDLYWPKAGGFEVEIEPDEDPQETAAYYEEMGKRLLGKRKSNPRAKKTGWVLIFSGRKGGS